MYGLSNFLQTVIELAYLFYLDHKHIENTCTKQNANSLVVQRLLLYKPFPYQHFSHQLACKNDLLSTIKFPKSSHMNLCGYGAQFGLVHSSLGTLAYSCSMTYIWVVSGVSWINVGEAYTCFLQVLSSPLFNFSNIEAFKHYARRPSMYFYE